MRKFMAGLGVALVLWSMGPANAQVKDVKVDELKKYVEVQSVKLGEFKPTEGNYGTLPIEVVYKNISDKTLSGVKIFIENKDVFGDNIANYSFKDEKDFKPGDVRTFSKKFGVEKSDFGDRPLSKIKTDAYPVQVVTSEGDSMKDPRYISF